MKQMVRKGIKVGGFIKDPGTVGERGTVGDPGTMGKESGNKVGGCVGDPPVGA